MRLAVYTDYSYHRVEGRVYGARAFARFLGGLRSEVDRLTLIGRLDPREAEARYPVGDGVDLVALPYYPSLARLWRALPALVRSLRTFWRRLPEFDCVWLLGPHPLALAFAVLARIRRRRVVLGVRQDLPAYVRNRHPRRPPLWLAAWILEAAFRALARHHPVVAVGPELARNYRRSPRVLQLTVSMMSEVDLVTPEAARARSYDGEIVLLSVGRLEEEKNPLLLADTLAILNGAGARWRLRICGEGDMEEKLRGRLEASGEGERSELCGYVPFGERLTELYRSSHALLHTSWTEGLPAVIPEALAAGLPVVAADVGGISEAVGDAALLVPPGDPGAAASALEAVAQDAHLRARLIASGHQYATGHTVEAEVSRLGEFLRGA